MKEATKRKIFNKIAKDIKEIKIQGARNIAKKALEAYALFPTKTSLKKLISLRPTEPLLVNVLHKTEKESPQELIKHFDSAQKEINKIVYDLIKSEDVIYTHCHSTNVTNALIYAKKKGKKFEVYNTETRPLFQGRKTAKELKKAGIKVTMFIDSGMDVALSRKQKTNRVNKILIGADALLKTGAINKIPLYIVADSWKYSPKSVKIEERNFHEVWKKIPKKSHIKIRNPAFELVKKKYIKGIISELGLMKYQKFLKEVKR